ncbi:MAG: hypothetical protein ABH830_01210 [Patescibacteria group bacterium]
MEKKNPDETEEVKNVPEVEGYIYCSEHDIFYNEKLKEEAEEERERLAKGEFTKFAALNVEACPLCARKFADSIRAIHQPVDPTPGRYFPKPSRFLKLKGKY